MECPFEKIHVNLRVNIKKAYATFTEGASMKKGQMVEGVVKKVKFPNKGIVDVSGEEKKRHC